MGVCAITFRKARKYHRLAQRSVEYRHYQNFLIYPFCHGVQLQPPLYVECNDFYKNRMKLLLMCLCRFYEKKKKILTDRQAVELKTEKNAKVWNNFDMFSSNWSFEIVFCFSAKHTSKNGSQAYQCQTDETPHHCGRLLELNV